MNNVNFSSMEQYMMYKKAVCFDDKNTANKILVTMMSPRLKLLGGLSQITTKATETVLVNLLFNVKEGF